MIDRRTSWLGIGALALLSIATVHLTLRTRGSAGPGEIEFPGGPSSVPASREVHSGSGAARWLLLRVMDPRGGPVSDAEVSILDTQDNYRPLGRTDESGLLEYRGDPPDPARAPKGVRVQHDHWGALELVLDEKPSREILLRYEAASSITLCTRRPAGIRPLITAVLGTESGTLLENELTTLGTDRYRFDGVLPGRYVIRHLSDSGAGSVPVHVQDNRSEIEVEVELSAVAQSLSSRILCGRLFVDGQIAQVDTLVPSYLLPIHSTRVRGFAKGLTLRTDAHGRFCIESEWLATGMTRLVFNLDGYDSWERIVDGSSDLGDVHLVRSIRRLRLVDESGTPLSQVRSYWPEVQRTGVSDRDGWIEWPQGLSALTVILSAMHRSVDPAIPLDISDARPGGDVVVPIGESVLDLHVGTQPSMAIVVCLPPGRLTVGGMMLPTGAGTVMVPELADVAVFIVPTERGKSERISHARFVSAPRLAKRTRLDLADGDVVRYFRAALGSEAAEGCVHVQSIGDRAIDLELLQGSPYWAAVLNRWVTESPGVSEPALEVAEVGFVDFVICDGRGGHIGTLQEKAIPIHLQGSESRRRRLSELGHLTAAQGSESRRFRVHPGGWSCVHVPPHWADVSIGLRTLGGDQRVGTWPVSTDRIALSLDGLSGLDFPSGDGSSAPAVPPR